MQLEDFHQWSAWENLDPQLQRNFSGAARDIGALYQWVGNRKAGSGGMEVIEAAAPFSLHSRLDFVQPVKAHNLADFSVLTDNEHSLVSWAMVGPNPFMAHVMGLFSIWIK